MDILMRAHQIMIARSEEKDREYGGFVESVTSAAKIATEMTGMNITPEVMCKCLIALKVGRMRYNLKDDTLVDAVAYIEGLNQIKIKQDGNKSLRKKL